LSAKESTDIELLTFSLHRIIRNMYVKVGLYNWKGDGFWTVVLPIYVNNQLEG